MPGGGGGLGSLPAQSCRSCETRLMTAPSRKRTWPFDTLGGNWSLAAHSAITDSVENIPRSGLFYSVQRIVD
jgi:hypothetical protein